MSAGREAKKQETRQRISDVATGLFFARGFEAVTLDEVAAAAKVSKMTVFNYFPRKEDLVLDRQDDLRLTFFREAIRARPRGQSPVSAIRALVGTLIEEKHPFTRFDRDTTAFWQFVAATPPLEARLRELADEAAQGLATELAGPEPHGAARLAGRVIVLTVHEARHEGARIFAQRASPKRATAAFAMLMERGLVAVDGILTGVEDAPRREPLRRLTARKTSLSGR